MFCLLITRYQPSGGPSVQPRNPALRSMFLLSATTLALRLGATRRRARTVAAPVGTVQPDAELLNGRGAATTLYAAAGNGVSVLVFYRGAWCPFSHNALSTCQAQLLPQLAGRGVTIVAISPQQPAGSLAMQQKHKLAFAVVSDPGNTIAGRLGLLTQPPDECLAAQRQLGLDLTDVNADGTVTLPMTATVILDSSHTVRWIDVHPGHRIGTEPQQVLRALQQLEHRSD